MNKIQRVILILIAFGVVSIVMSQANNFYSYKTGNTGISIGYDKDKFSGNTVLLNANDEHFRRVHETQYNAKISNKYRMIENNSQIVTNIYQTTNGSFYFEVSQQDMLQHKSTLQHDNIERDTELKQQFIPSHLGATDVQVSIAGPIARTKMTQTFENHSSEVRSGIYVFPLPEDAAVDSLKMTIGDRHIIGQIQRKDIANKIYDEAKNKGQKASLVSQLRPNMFTSQVANIPPNASIEVTIEYQQLVKHEDFNFSLRLPLSITPRYTPSSSLEEGLEPSDTTFLLQPYLETNTSIKIHIKSGIPVTNIESEHHPISVTNDQHVYEVKLDTKHPVNKDFVLNWSLQPGLNIQAAHLRYVDENFDYGLITLVPPKLAKLNTPRQIVFVLDVSGSMVGESLMQAKKAIALAIKDLNDSDYFNLISFHSQADSLFVLSKSANAGNKEHALNYLYNLEANGGTEIKRALEMVFKHEEQENMLNQVLLVTDGSVSNEHELLAHINKSIGDFRLFTVGIGSAPNSYFMSESAYVGKGSYTFIGDVSHVENKMSDLLNKLKHPSLTNLTLDFEDTAKAFEFEIYPSILPDLYASELLHISYRKRKLDKFSTPHRDTSSDSNIATSELLNDLSTLRINGEFLTETTDNGLAVREWSNSLPIYNIKNSSGLDKNWARQKIRSLTNQRYKTLTSGGQETEKFADNINEHITQLALKYSLVSEFTSLIAVDNTPSDKIMNKDAKQREMTAKMVRLPKTSTNSLLYLLTGILVICAVFLSKKLEIGSNRQQKDRCLGC